MLTNDLPPALAVKGLRKHFGRPAVDDLDLDVRAGEFYLLLGPNGAGKTTTLRMVSGLLKPDAGAIRIFGIDAIADPAGAKQITGWLSDEPMIYDKLTPLEYLEFVAGLWHVEGAVAAARARELLGWLNLEQHARERCEGFLSRHAPESGASGGAGARSQVDHPRRAAHRAGCRLRTPGQGRADGKSTLREQCGDDHAYSGDRRADGGPDRRDCGWPLDRRGHLGGIARPHGARTGQPGRHVPGHRRASGRERDRAAE